MSKPYDYTQTAEELEEKEREDALNYFTAAYYYEILPAARAENRLTGYEAFYGALSQTKSGKEFREELMRVFQLGCEIHMARRQLADFYALDDYPELDEKLSESLQALKLEKTCLPVVAFCAAGKDMERLAPHIWSDEETAQPRTKDVDELRKSSLAAAIEAVFLYRNGDPRHFGKALAEGLRSCCSGFSASADADEAACWSAYAEDILYLLKSRPELIKAGGLTRRQLNIAEDLSSMGRDILDGISAVNIMAECSRIKELKLTEAQSGVLKEKVAKMQKAIRGRGKILEAWDEPVPAKTLNI